MLYSSKYTYWTEPGSIRIADPGPVFGKARIQAKYFYLTKAIFSGAKLLYELVLFMFYVLFEVYIAPDSSKDPASYTSIFI